MKTLVIHLKDKTTKFLSVLYKGKGYKVITDRLPLSYIMEQVKKHDRIMMMGHGTPRGLIGYSHVFGDSDFINLLREKDCVCIWCNADMYVQRYGIKGFYTGMFISEVGEAQYFNIDVDQDVIDYSNHLFVEELKRVLDSPNVLNEIKSTYVGDCPVIRFNNDRLYYRNNNEIPEDIINFKNNEIL